MVVFNLITIFAILLSSSLSTITAQGTGLGSLFTPLSRTGSVIAQSFDTNATCGPIPTFASTYYLAQLSSADVGSSDVSAGCGTCIIIRETTAPIQNYWILVTGVCNNCPSGSIIVNPSFQLSNGQWDSSKWEALTCDPKESISYMLMGSSSPTPKILVQNHNIPITKLEVQINGNFIAATRGSDNYWSCSCPSPLPAPLTVRLTGINTQTLIDVIPTTNMDNTKIVGQNAVQFKDMKNTITVNQTSYQIPSEGGFVIPVEYTVIVPSVITIDLRSTSQQYGSGVFRIPISPSVGIANVQVTQQSLLSVQGLELQIGLVSAAQYDDNTITSKTYFAVKSAQVTLLPRAPAPPPPSSSSVSLPSSSPSSSTTSASSPGIPPIPTTIPPNGTADFEISYESAEIPAEARIVQVDVIRKSDGFVVATGFTAVFSGSRGKVRITVKAVNSDPVPQIDLKARVYMYPLTQLREVTKTPISEFTVDVGPQSSSNNSGIPGYAIALIIIFIILIIVAIIILVCCCCCKKTAESV